MTLQSFGSNRGWFGVGISLTNDNTRSTVETDYTNIISGNGTSKPQLKVTFTILSP
jgi:hypothetical protein